MAVKKGSTAQAWLWPPHCAVQVLLVQIDLEGTRASRVSRQDQPVSELRDAVLFFGDASPPAATIANLVHLVSDFKRNQKSGFGFVVVVVFLL